MQQEEQTSHGRDFLVGFPEIDADHARIVGLVNTMKAARDASSVGFVDQSTVQKQMHAQLLDYLHDHFVKEEGILASYDCPNLQNHKNVHAAFHSEVLGWSESFDKLVNRVDEWVEKHVANYDRKDFAVIIATLEIQKQMSGSSSQSRPGDSPSEGPRVLSELAREVSRS